MIIVDPKNSQVHSTQKRLHSASQHFFKWEGYGSDVCLSDCVGHQITRKRKCLIFPDIGSIKELAVGIAQIKPVFIKNDKVFI
jgi:hypothetical protein